MNNDILELKQKIDAAKYELADKAKLVKELNEKQIAVEESLNKVFSLLSDLETKIEDLSIQDKSEAEVNRTGLSDDVSVSGSVDSEEIAIQFSDTLYPQHLMAAFSPFKLLQDERMALQPYVHLIRDSSLFDAGWYLETYPDIQKSHYAEDPAMHYLLYGGFDGRHPGPSFNSVAYFLENPDVYKNQTNPLLHFVLFGFYEERIVYKVV